MISQTERNTSKVKKIVRKVKEMYEAKTNPLAVELSLSGLRQHERSDVDEAESEVVGSGACRSGTMADGG